MKSTQKHKLANNRTVITVMVMLFFCVPYIICLSLFLTSINNQYDSIQHERSRNLVIKTRHKKPKVSLPPPKAAPDYSIPPIVDGMAPVISTVKTNQPIVFLGIDDGNFKDNLVVDAMKNNNIKASLFLSKSAIANNPDFFKQITAQGSIIENHTLTHDVNMVKTQTYQQQKNEICGMSDYEFQQYGVRPTLYRPPGGAYSDTMRKAAADCGMKAIVTWIAKANGGSMQYQIGNRLRPGDIVLMHFRPEFKDDMKAFTDAMAASGLHTELIEDAIK